MSESMIAYATRAAKDAASSQTAANALAPTNDQSGTSVAPGTTGMSEDEQIALAKSESNNLDSLDPQNITPVQKQYSEDDALMAGTQSQTFSPSGNAPTVVPRDNPLHSYPSYTYGLSLHLLTVETYNKAMDDPKTAESEKGKVTLISSASRFHENRPSMFRDDFYFESLKMKTVIGLNAQAKGTNAITLSFTIIEPYGMTLLDRIRDVVLDKTLGIGEVNYLALPYLLEINFFGADDTGKLSKLGLHTKFIPICLIGFKIKASVKGAEYAIEAVPFGHQGHFTSVQATKANFEITAKTVGDFFKNDDGTDAAAGAQVNDAIAENSRLIATQKQQLADAARTIDTLNKDQYDTVSLNSSSDAALSAAKKVLQDARTITPNLTTLSYPAAYNAWNTATSKPKGTLAEIADDIRFDFTGGADIASAVLNIPKQSPKTPQQTALAADKGSVAKVAAMGPNFELGTFSVNSGSSINDIINMVIMSSEYVRKQLTGENSQLTEKNVKLSDNTLIEQNKKTALKWFKIIPRIKLKAYDKIRKTYGKSITFCIKQWDYYNGKIPAAPMSQPPGAVKEYNYIYTGKNKDIIAFDMDFNALYFTASAANTANPAAASGAPDVNKPDDEKNSNKGIASTPSSSSALTPATRAQTSAAGSMPNSLGQTNLGAKAASLKDNLYTGAAGDLLNVKLQILGDPDFIKQDDIFYNPLSKGSSGSEQYVAGGSIAMDNGQVYCMLSFKTPVDFDDSTGLLSSPDSTKYYESKFSGYYQVLVVESEFRQGKFTQTLELVRQANQPRDQVGAKTDSNRADTKPVLKAEANYDQFDPQTSNPVPAIGLTREEDASMIANSQPTTPPLTEEQIQAQDNPPADLQNIAANGETVPIGENSTTTGTQVVGENPKPAATQQQLQAQITAYQSNISTMLNEISNLTTFMSSGSATAADMAAAQQTIRDNRASIDNYRNLVAEAQAKLQG